MGEKETQFTEELAKSHFVNHLFKTIAEIAKKIEDMEKQIKSLKHEVYSCKRMR